MRQQILSLFFLLFLPLVASGQFGNNNVSSKASIHSEVSNIKAGEEFTIAIKLEHPDEWYSYYINPGSFGEAFNVNWETPKGINITPIQWPIPSIYTVESFGESVTSYTYHNSVTFLFKVSVSPDITPSESQKITANSTWQICSKSACIPEEATLVLDFSSPLNTDGNKELLAAASTSLPQNASILNAAAVENDSNISLLYSSPAHLGPIKEVYFFSADTQIDAQREQKFTSNGDTITHLTKRNQGNETFNLETPPILDTISGILHLKGEKGSSAYSINLPLQQKGTPKTATPTVTLLQQKETEKSTIPSSELLAKGAKLYDLNAKPEFVTLTGVKEKKHSFLTALLSVFVGGLLLNLMPCVFPVLGLKVMSFVQQGGEDPKKIRIHGLVFAFGLLFCMWIIAGIVIALNSNWGVQLANPTFLAGIIVLLFLMGLNMAGVFEFGTSMTSIGGNLQMKKGYSGSFFSGVLTTLIATPCSGPFLGSTIGYTLAQPPAQASLIFTVFAIGIASPYILFAFFPKLINALPKPGAWMETFKKAMAFPLFASALFFLNGFATQTGVSGTMWLISALIVIALAAWVFGHWGTPFRSKAIRYQIGYGLTFFFTLGALYLINTATKQINPVVAASNVDSKGLRWESWFPGKMELARENKKITWIDYTAKWCATCQLNKSRVFKHDEVLELLKEYDVELVKADYTSRDISIEKDLKRFNRRNIPVNILVPEDPNAPLIMLPELIGPEDAIKALKAARS